MWPRDGRLFCRNGTYSHLPGYRCVRKSQARPGHHSHLRAGLEEIVKRNTAQNRSYLPPITQKAVASATVCFIAVPTPSREDGSCDISYVESAATQIAAHMTGYKIIVNKSTVPVGTHARVAAVIREVNPKAAKFDVVSNPEFLKEGAAVQDCLKPDRIIIGADIQKRRNAQRDLLGVHLQSR